MSDLPTEAEINVHGSPDEKWAVEHMLGHTAAEIQERLEDNFIYLSEALSYIGPVACAYYGRAAIDAAWNLAKNDIDDEGDALRILLGVFKLRYELDGWDVGGQPGFTDAVVKLCEQVETEFASLHIEEGSRDRIRAGYRDLYERLGGPEAEPLEPQTPIPAGLPTDADLNVYDTLDEREAARTFRGLTLADVEQLFTDEAWRYSSMLADLGPKAFAYYLPAAIAGARSPEAKGMIDSPSSDLFLPLRSRAQREWDPIQFGPLQLDDGMLERLPELIELMEFLEQEPPFKDPYLDDEDTEDRDRTKYFRAFRHVLERTRDGLPRLPQSEAGDEPETLWQASESLIFLPDAVPEGREEFMQWYRSSIDWKPGRSYEDPGGCDARLRAWFDELTQELAPITGPLARDEEDESLRADFCLGQNFILLATSHHESAVEMAEDLAAKHGLGVFWLGSDDREVWLPDGKGNMVLAHSSESPDSSTDED